MKNFWLQRRKKREFAKIATMIGVFGFKNPAKGIGALFPWRRKKDTKTQP